MTDGHEDGAPVWVVVFVVCALLWLAVLGAVAMHQL